MANPEVDKQRANQAMQLLDNPLLKEAIHELREECVRELTDSKLDDDDARRIARHKLEGLRQVVVSLRRHMETGRLVVEGEASEKEMESFLHQYGL